MQERADVVNRVQKVLETANIKLATVASDILGKSGRAMLDALVAGETDTEVLADLARGQLRRKRAELIQALAGRVSAHHRFLLRQLLNHIDYLDSAIRAVQEEITQRLAPYTEAIERLQTIPALCGLVYLSRRHSRIWPGARSRAEYELYFVRCLRGVASVRNRRNTLSGWDSSILNRKEPPFPA